MVVRSTQKVVSRAELDEFRRLVQDYYHQSGRHDLLWRRPGKNGKLDPYAVLVSEIMLQQTQVSRVMPKYQQFMQQFPSASVLAKAPLSDVLTAWSGLGYNRRAKFLHQAAQRIVAEHAGVVPGSFAELVALSGVGSNTAGAILAYAFNEALPFVETNIRAVFIHHFFPGEQHITDADILMLVTQTLDSSNPREWYWALMDYGSFLKSVVPNPSRASKHHIKQTPFDGSVLQLRGVVIKQLVVRPTSRQQLHEIITDIRVPQVLLKLEAEGFVVQSAGMYHLAK